MSIAVRSVVLLSNLVSFWGCSPDVRVAQPFVESDLRELRQSLAVAGVDKFAIVLCDTAMNGKLREQAFVINSDGATQLDAVSPGELQWLDGVRIALIETMDENESSASRVLSIFNSDTWKRQEHVDLKIEKGRNVGAYRYSNDSRFLALYTEVSKQGMARLEVRNVSNDYSTMWSLETRRDTFGRSWWPTRIEWLSKDSKVATAMFLKNETIRERRFFPWPCIVSKENSHIEFPLGDKPSLDYGAPSVSIVGADGSYLYCDSGFQLIEIDDANKTVRTIYEHSSKRIVQKVVRLNENELLVLAKDRSKNLSPIESNEVIRLNMVTGRDQILYRFPEGVGLVSASVRSTR